MKPCEERFVTDFETKANEKNDFHQSIICRQAAIENEENT
jgi:hypothetical protein